MENKLISLTKSFEDESIRTVWNKDDFYHMLPIINNVIYDKEESSMNLFTLKLYKSQK